MAEPRIVKVLRTLAGERLVAVQPPLSPVVEDGPVDWRRRVYFHTGRALSDRALTLEQNERGGHLAAAGRLLSAGVVAGLEVELEPPPGTADGAQRLHVAPGFGVTAGGEDIVVPHSLAVPVEELGALPEVGVLVLRPVAIAESPRFDPRDPCEVDETEDPFSDRIWVDAVQLRLVPWSVAELGEPPAAGPRRRNEIAYRVFEAERALGPGEVLSFQAEGLPLAVVVVADGRVQFLDRAAVVREGGRARHRAGLPTGGGSRFLWRARIQQVVEEIFQRDRLGPAIGPAASFARFLPPAGVLPLGAVTLDQPGAGFFPASYSVTAQPVPLEQVEELVEQCAALAPFDTDVADAVMLLVPVPQAVYEPRLLVDEPLSDEFDLKITEFSGRRALWLGKRRLLRGVLTRLAEALRGAGKGPPFADPDPEQLEPDEAVAPEEEARKDELGYGIEDGKIKVIEDLKTELGERAFLAEERRLLDEQPLGELVRLLTEKLDRADDALDMGFLRAHTDIYRVRQHVLGEAAATRLATSPAMAAIAKGTSAVAVREDLNRFFESVRKPRVVTPPPGGPSPAAPPVTPPPPATPPPPGGGAPSPVLGAAPPPGNTIGGALLSSARLGLTASTLSRAVTARPDLGAGLPTTVAGPTAVGAIGGTRTGAALRGAGLAAVSAGVFAGGGRPPVEDAPEPPVVVLDADRFNLGLGGFAGSAFPASSFESEPSSKLAVRVFSSASKADVVSQQPVKGDAYQFRSLSIAERIETPQSIEAKNYSVANRFDIVATATNLRIDVDDLLVPNVIKRDAAGNPELDPSTQAPRRTAVLLGQLRRNPDGSPNPNGHRVLLDDPHALNADEASIFSDAIALIDSGVSFLRQVEERVAAYRRALESARRVVAAVEAQLELAAQRLAVIDGEVAEARHDVATARALKTDEQARLRAINDRRASVRREHVRLYAYLRPRSMQALIELPALPLDPAFISTGEPACLDEHETSPPEIGEMVAVLRESPLRWFTGMPTVAQRLDRLDLLHGTLQTAMLRASAFLEPALAELPFTLAARTVAPGEARFGKSLVALAAANRRLVAEQRRQVARIDLSRFVGLGWQQSYEGALEVVTPGDLIEGGHGRTVVAEQAARELERIAQGATCLHEQFARVVPAIRLGWAERLSQFDAPVSLRNLAGLPRFGEVDYLARQEMQTLVDWLFSRIDSRIEGAVKVMNDLVRICLLLASHSPVNQIIAGDLRQPAVARPGLTLPVAVDVGKVRVGMGVVFYKGAAAVAQAVVEDLRPDGVSARVVKTAEATVDLAIGTRAHFTSAMTLTREVAWRPSGGRL